MEQQVLSKFRLYDGGSVQFFDARVAQPIAFAHVADLHLSPDPPALWPPQYRNAIQWWDIEMKHPNRTLPKMLDEIRSAAVDFVFFGGDVLDYFHSESAERVVRLCRQRNLTAYFQLGNHDWESDRIRFVTHEYDADLRAVTAERLRGIWRMPGLYYSFEQNGVRFISLDVFYGKVAEGYAGWLDDRQADWFIDQLCYQGPIIVFHHVPFNCPTVEFRFRAVWSGILGSMAEDNNGRRVRQAIEGCPNILGTFAAHSHLRSEDAMGQTCQFSVEAGLHGQWRYVRVANSQPPKSLRAKGTPDVLIQTNALDHR